jgi:histidyl-tRNA synthetase
LLQQLRKAGISAEKDYLDRKMKAQLKAADRTGANFVAILGEDEIKKNVINLKNMETGNQTEISLSDFVSEFKKLSTREV